MLEYLLCVIVIVLVFVLVHQLILRKSNLKENFQSLGTSVLIDNPELDAMNQSNQPNIVGEEAVGSSEGSYSSPNSQPNNSVPDGIDMDDYVLKTDIERAARASTRKYCPVSPEFNPADYIKKTEIDLETACPKLPDLKDYVLKSTIPPVQKCPACICPKVKVSAGMCKECPEPRNNCPKCQPCGVEQCRDVIQCAPGDQQISCPKCPAPMPCPEIPEKVCPAFELPESDIKCPAPKPCPLPGACPDKQGRCPEEPESKCRYYGIKEIVNERSVNEIVNELLLSDDPELKELLDNLKSKLDINLTPSPVNMPTNPVNIYKPTTAAARPTTSVAHSTTTALPQPSPTTNALLPGATTQSAHHFNPQADNQANHQYEFNTYGYSTVNRVSHLGNPTPTYQSNVQNTALEGSNNLGCDINDSNCSYNTNLNI